ncbi:MAG: ABC transporter permease, partial [Planctomycetota bacterium]
MFHPIVFFACWRYFQTRKIIWLSTLGVMIGVMVLIIVMSVMSGFQNDFRSRLQGTLSELTFTLKDPQNDYIPLLQKMKSQFSNEILEVAPRLESLILVGAPRGWRGGMLIGIEEKQERQVGSFSDYLMTSKKFKSEQFEDWMKPASLLSLQWVALHSESLSAEDPFFTKNDSFYTRVFFQQNRLFKSFINNFPNQTKEDLFAFIFNEQGQIVAEEFYSDINKTKGFPPPSEKLQQYQRILDDMMQSFKNKQLEKLLSHFHEDLELYEIHSEDEEEFKTPSHYHLQKSDPFDLKAFQKSSQRYFPILVGTEFILQRGVYLREEGSVTILGGYYHRGLKKIRSISKKYTIVGTFKTGMHEYDSNVIYCPLRGVQQLQMSPEALE